MSFAVIQTGGKQYKVKASDILKVEKIKDRKPESTIEFNEILAYGDDKNLEKKIFVIKDKLKNNLPTIPSTISEELACNIFLRAKNLEDFSKLRDLKDNF